MAYKVKKSKVKEKKYEIRRYKVYSFENLTKESQEKALENYRYWAVENENLVDQDDFLMDMGLKEKTLEVARRKVGQGNTLFVWKTAYYNLDRQNYLQFVELEVRDDEAFRQELGVSKKTWDKVHYNFDNSGEKDTEINFESYDTELTNKEKNELQNAHSNFDVLMKKAKENLKNDYEYRMSDEYLIEGFKANDYKFTEQGKID